jgi:hypothetical protein
MAAEKVSLRALVDKWLAPTTTRPARVLRTGRMSHDRTRFVCVGTQASSGPRSLFLFRHGDGSWCVFPPTDARPAMCCLRVGDR